MTEPAVQNAQAKSELTPRQDRRRHPRAGCVVGATLCDLKDAEWVCLVVDISVCGARVAFWQEEEPPLAGELRMQTAPGRVVPVFSTLVHRFRVGNRWLAGYRLERMLTNEEFKSLVQAETNAL
jgi:hypothetical protein